VVHGSYWLSYWWRHIIQIRQFSQFWAQNEACSYFKRHFTNTCSCDGVGRYLIFQNVLIFDDVSVIALWSLVKLKISSPKFPRKMKRDILYATFVNINQNGYIWMAKLPSHDQFTQLLEIGEMITVHKSLYNNLRRVAQFLSSCGWRHIYSRHSRARELLAQLVSLCDDVLSVLVVGN
jgi:hypothetical protein